METGSPTPMPPSSPPTQASLVDSGITTPEVNVDESPSPSFNPKISSKKRMASEMKTESDDEDESSTPKKAKGTPAKGTPKSAAPKSSTPRKRKANPNPAAGLPLARTYEQCAEHDKMLVDWKEAGKGWTAIGKEWEKITGNKAKHSTLPNRYSRLISNFVVIKEEDNPKLIEAKQEVEENFEKEKWGLISAAMQDKGATEYKPGWLQRQYKKLMLMADDLQADDKKPANQRPARKVVDYVTEADGTYGEQK